MFFLNFGLAQFLMLAGAASLFTAALYLLDRSRRKQVVSTLRFWTQARQPVQTSRRRHIQQPWSLLLQVIGVLLLLAAIAQPRLGNPFGKPGNSVLILETSAWMLARPSAERATLMDTARQRAGQWLASVPATDRVMLVRADALATPATAFESDRARIRAAIAQSEPGATSLDIHQAINFARRAQSLSSGAGEIVFVGSGRIRDRKETSVLEGDGLRVILIPDEIENIGLRRLSARPSVTDHDLWEIFVGAHNYGARAHTVNLTVSGNAADVETRRLLLPSGANSESKFSWRSAPGGLLKASLTPANNARQDGFPDDDSATLQLPAVSSLHVVVYTSRPDAVRPLLAANPRVDAEFRSPDAYRKGDKGLVILDRFVPSSRPEANSIWIDPPQDKSPVPVLKRVDQPHGMRWVGNSPLGEGLRAGDTKLDSASVFRTGPADIIIAAIDNGPVMLARPGPLKMVIIGFDPALRGMRYQLSTPLVFANVLRWMDPEIFRQSDFSVQAAGTVVATVDPELEADQLQVTRGDTPASAIPIPFTVQRGSLHFFSGVRDTVRVASRDRDSLYALTLPEMWDVKWRPPAGVKRGIPPSQPLQVLQTEIWPWLAVLGAACLIGEWFLFAGRRRARVKSIAVRRPLRKAS